MFLHIVLFKINYAVKVCGRLVQTADTNTLYLLFCTLDNHKLCKDDRHITAALQRTFSQLI